MRVIRSRNGLLRLTECFDWSVDVPDLLLDGEQNSVTSGTVNMVWADDWQVFHSGVANDDDQCDVDNI